MWTLLKSLLLEWALFRVLLKSLGSLALLIPVALFLKSLGWPVLVVLLALGLPILLVLFLVGLPVFAVLALGSMLIGGLFAALSLGLAVLKLLLPFVAIVLLLRWLATRPFRRPGEG